MATIEGMNKARALASEARTVVGGAVNGLGRLILSRYDGSTFDAGSVVGPTGPQGVGPTGTLIMSASDNVPSGWLLCDGSPVSRTVYSDLFASIGEKYGAGDGSLTFNLPDMRDRVAVGKGAESQFDDLGKVGGESEVTLKTAEMPSHTHTQNSHNHTQNSHNHSQDSHDHSQYAHDHSQSSHNHSQDSHDHSMSAHDHGSRAGSSYYFPSFSDPSNDTHGNLSGSGKLSSASNNNGSAYHTTTGTTTTNPHAKTATNNSTTANNGTTAANNYATTASNNATTASNNATTATNQNTGGGDAHNNVQKFGVVNYLIKI